MTIAVTGPLASGKSTFVEVLGELGAETVSSDEVVHELLAEDEKTIAAVVERYGEHVRGERGIDRESLGQEVFADAEALRDLEEILHPRVREETDRRAAASDAGLFVTEIPLLFEGGGSERFDVTVAVVTPEERRKKWAEKRGRAIEARQLHSTEKARRSDVVVENDGDIDRLKEQARNFVDRVLGGQNRGGEGGAGEA